MVAANINIYLKKKIEQCRKYLENIFKYLQLHILQEWTVATHVNALRAASPLALSTPNSLNSHDDDDDDDDLDDLDNDLGLDHQALPLLS